MAQPEQWPLALLVDLREEMAETRATVRHLGGEVGELKQDMRRLEARVFQLLLAQLATLATALGALAATLAA